ncbi:aminotransferase class I/II-fold pyridoxal phosphate-dependent enzyme [Desulfotalea psychrophila]|nr:8-amino-7-oxononanoate synthase [Desulfotalea psychrophila]
MGFRQELDQLEARGRLRSLSPLVRQSGCSVQKNGRSLLNLCSNDYLGLGADVALQQRFYAGVQDEAGFLGRYGLASTSSRLLSGDSPLAHTLEDEIARAHGAESALLFNSGYHANIGILPTLAGRDDLILSDKLNHASIHDGLTLCRATHKRFAHGDYGQLRSLLERMRADYRRVFIVSESVFSMDGDVADIAHLVALKEEFNCYLYLDEAHAVGLYGAQGLGKAEELGLLAQVDILVGTFGKAWASVGAYVVCLAEIRDYLLNHSRSLIFTTAQPPVQIAWNLFVFRQSLTLGEKRAHLQLIAARLRRDIKEAGFLTAGATNIIPLIIGDDVRTLALAGAMEERGFFLLPIRPPTVPVNTSRFRISLSANMSWQDLAGLVPALQEIL